MKALQYGETPLFFDQNTKIEIEPCAYAPYIRERLQALFACTAQREGVFCCSITMTLGVPDAIRALFPAETANLAATAPVAQDDFVEGIGGAQDAKKAAATDEEYAIVFGEQTHVYANAPSGFLRALSTIMMQSDKGELRVQTLLDSPACAVRGYRVYMPGRKTMRDFIDMLDFLVYYKYNTLILEIGGAMEYKRHPLINEKWVAFCADMNEYSGKASDVQKSQSFAKNSIHSENGDGSFLTQEECRTLAAECARRGIEIIPECPTLSHSDYICLAYPALAERNNDPYPDTYCPSNPDSYRVVFDILDEVIDVFAPRQINIGHDECYTIGVCERCRDKDIARLYADDVAMIKDYLYAKGVGTMMWGEKLLKARYYNGNRIGGWNDDEIYGDKRVSIPWLFRCADLMPEGVTYLHWYWEFGTHLDDEYHAREYPVVFGNFSALKCEDFRTRINRGVKGGFVSNWGSCAPEYMQRNFQYYDLISSAFALWDEGYDSCDAPDLKERTLADMYAKFAAAVKHPLTVHHAAHHSVKPLRFWCGSVIDDAVYLLGHYELTYTDGTKARLPVKLGTNIANRNANDREVREAAYSTRALPDAEGFLFEHLYENPHPDKEIEKICYIPCKGKEHIKVEYAFPK